MQVNQLIDKEVEIITVTILAGENTSSAGILFGCTAAVFQTPSEMTNASVTFLGSIDKGVTFAPICNTTNDIITYEISTDESRAYPLDKNIFAGFDALKIVTPDGAEDSDRIITIKPFSI